MKILCLDNIHYTCFAMLCVGIVADCGELVSGVKSVTQAVISGVMGINPR